MDKIAKIDRKNLQKIRKNVTQFIADSAKKHDSKDAVLLDIAPQDHEGAKPYFKKATVQTLDIDPSSGSTYIADICKNNQKTIPSDTFDLVVCTEVLEHTLQPFDAATEIERIVKPGGYIFVSVPFNLRIHGPLPDCWRISEYGLRALFKSFDIISLNELKDEERFLMPVHYTMVARKRSNR